MDRQQRAKLQGRVNGRVLYYAGLLTCGMGLLSPVAYPIEFGGDLKKPLGLMLIGLLLAVVGKGFAKWGDSGVNPTSDDRTRGER